MKSVRQQIIDALITTLKEYLDGEVEQGYISYYSVNDFPYTSVEERGEKAFTIETGDVREHLYLTISCYLYDEEDVLGKTDDYQERIRNAVADFDNALYHRGFIHNASITYSGSSENFKEPFGLATVDIEIGYDRNVMPTNMD